MFHNICEAHGIWHDNDQIFRYMGQFEDKTDQLSFFWGDRKLHRYKQRKDRCAQKSKPPVSVLKTGGFYLYNAGGEWVRPGIDGT